MRISIFIVWLGAFKLAGCASAQQAVPPPPPQPEVITPEARSVDSGFLLSADEQEALLLRAEQGDRDAAFRLSFHYVSAKDRPAAERWRRVAAENGHPIAQYNEWFVLRDRRDCRSMNEALAWLEAAVAGGVKDAGEDLAGYKMLAQSCVR